MNEQSAARASVDRTVTAMAWSDGEGVDTQLDLTEVAEIAHDPGRLVWVDLLRPEPAQLAEVFADLGLPATAVEDALAPHERVKAVRHESHTFFTVYAAWLGAAEPGTIGHRLRTARLSGVLMPTALVTIRTDDALDLAPLMEGWRAEPDALRHGSGALAHGLLDHVVDGHFEAIQALDDEIESLEDVLFSDGRTPGAFQRRVYALRKDLVALRRAVLPMREVVNTLVRHAAQQGPLVPLYDDLYDHVLRASEWTESLRDMITSLFETNLSLQDARLNTIMKKLSGWAAIIAVPTAITGWFGQNIPFPGFGQPLGLWLSVALVAVCAGALYAVFRAQDWL